MKEGFLIGGGLITAGLMLELSVGPVAWEVFAWPVNAVVLALFLSIVVVMGLLGNKVYAFDYLTTYRAAVPAIVYAVALTIVMGLTRQTVNGTWVNNMLTFWPFVLIYVYMTVTLGLAVVKRLQHLHDWKHDIPFLLNHLGLFIALTTATLGSADMQRVKMITAVGEPEWRVLDQQGAVHEMPLAIELKRFIMETYDSGQPRRFASDIQILTKSGKNIVTTVDVNKPFEVEGWKIYQYGYDTQMGPMSRTSILELISDPWLPAVYVGIYMMLAGAVCLLLMGIRKRTTVEWNTRNVVLMVLLLAIAFVAVYFFMSALRQKDLMPALQSPWFKPHVIAYIFAYSLMGAAAVIAVVGIVRRWSSSAQLGITDGLVYAGLAFITIGMLFGALWAKEAWGHYWSWDPKETWAAITWFAYLVYIHYRRLPNHRAQVALWMLIACFALLQMCWWGINYLPSAQGSSVHVYGT